MKVRLDRLLVVRSLADSREKAQALVLAGEVLVNGQKGLKPGQGVAEDSDLQVLERPPYVSRGGVKLAAALHGFAIDVTGKTCLDIGASTGGFTDALLQHGAAKVYCIDVGTNQLAWKIRSDPRVTARESVNARYLRFEDIPEPVQIIGCDVSFISVTLILPALAPFVKTYRADLVILVKPQFEAGKGQVGKGGIVRDPEIRAAACSRVERAVQALELRTSLMESPILGAEGNREFLLYGRH